MLLRFPAPDFLLGCETSVQLYEQHARDLPIVGYHCHLDPAAIAGNTNHSEIIDLWIAGDPYKWRAMRQDGIPEQLITGDATDEGAGTAQSSNRQSRRLRSAGC